tara:strand:- start:2201 stop:2443 length:243 start_codon:yes stop_codon:yes gene_type:complete
MGHQNKIYDPHELIEGIQEFDAYLEDEYSVLHQVVHEHDNTRMDTEKDQIIQTELEARLDLLVFIKSRFRDHVYKNVNFS